MLGGRLIKTFWVCVFVGVVEVLCFWVLGIICADVRVVVIVKVRVIILRFLVQEEA